MSQPPTMETPSKVFSTWNQLLRLGSRRLATFVAVLAVVTASIAGVLAQSGPAGPSPATGHSSVIAQGVIGLAAGDLRWNVSTRTADSSQGPVTIDANGFVLATRSPILVLDPATSSKTRLAAGEALFVREGQSVAFETFGAPELYVFIALQPAEATIGSGEAIFESSAFAGDGIERDTDLIRDVLVPGEQLPLLAGALPTLVFVTSGEAVVTAPEGDTTLGAGTATLFNGPITITGGTTGTTFVAGYVGTSLGDATPAASPAASPEVIASPSPSVTAVPGTPLATFVPTEAPVGTPDPALDTDEDGIPDVNELAIGTDPNNLDTDGDLLYDGGELIYAVNPLNPDSDADGLTDGEEVYFSKTDPALGDTDGDGIDDASEVVNGTDPLDPTNGAGAVDDGTDTDGDGLTDFLEARYGTNPNDGDSDGDKVNDSNEVDGGTDPLDINSW